MKKQISYQKGFTIIEVVLVLAIAGLIFLMVFIALPALQRSQRDTGRKNDASTVAAALNSYQSSSRGSFSSLDSSRLQSYIEKLGQYDVTSVTLSGAAGSTTPPLDPSIDEIAVRVGVKCPTDVIAPGSPVTPVAGSSRQAAVVVRLENNGNSDKYQMHCVDV